MAAPVGSPASRCREQLTALLKASSVASASLVANHLIDEFGSLGRLLSAAPEAVAKVAGPTSRVPSLLAAISASMEQILASELDGRPLLANSTALHAYLRVAMAHATIERCRVLFLDTKNRLIRDECFGLGSVDAAAILPREVLKRALELDAAGLILVHNHPSGDPTPSKDDVRLTQQLAAAAHGLNLTLHDHVVVARTGTTSLRSLGLF